MLSEEELRELRMDCHAEDVAIDVERMRLWTSEQATRYFESGGLDEPGVRVLLYGDSIAGGWTRVSPQPTADCPWAGWLHRELRGAARQVEGEGIMGATTQRLLELIDGSLGLRTKMREATTALGRSYDLVIVSAGMNDHRSLSGGSMATAAWRDALVERLRTLQEVIHSAGARCVMLGTPSRACRGDGAIVSKTNARIRSKLLPDLFIDTAALMPAQEKHLFSLDGLHFTEEGYEELAIRLGKLLRGYLATGELYQGKTEDGRPHGFGYYNYSDGSVYQGEFIHGMKSGRGVLRSKDGAVYEGAFLNDVKHGRGVHRSASGAVYEGEYANDVRHGFGIATFPDGAEYEGAFVDDKFEGRGVFRYQDGTVHSGLFKNGLKHGPGCYTYATGAADLCVFEADDDVGEGVRFSSDRCTAWRLINGEINRIIDIDFAKDIARRIGATLSLSVFMLGA
ncbi:hypothetical protein AB1Y20_022054 [Prymnesium parvum]|uniref:SGNH hydrolase-type esterase domain-containing protein n=1 Tax=Prymnesium parvum TaxID=97485 RepID=A0AB34JG42_PRYPA